MTLKERFEAVGFRGPGFDLIRLLAATAVLVHHSLNVQYDAVAVDPIYRFSRGFTHLGFGAVAVFFVISGFLVTPGLVRSRNVIDFAVRRIVRIYPALIVLVLGITFIVGPVLTQLPLSTYFEEPGTLRYAKNIIPLTEDFLPGVFMPNGQPAIVDGSLWTLFYEVICYIALGAASVIGLLKYRWTFAALFAASFALSAGVAMGVVPEIILPNLFLTFNGLFLYFAAGVTLFLFANQIPWGWPWAIAALIAIIAPMPFGLAPLIAPAAIAYLVIYLGLTALPLSGRLENHDLSYGLYLVHATVLITLQILLPQLQIWWVVALLTLPISLGIAFLSWTFIEHPVLKRKSRIAHAIDDLAERAAEIMPPVRPLIGRPLRIAKAVPTAKGE